MKIRSIVILFILFFSGTVVAQHVTEKCYHNINCADFNLFIEEKNPLIVDVRLHKEYRNERVPNAIIASNRESLNLMLSKMDAETYILVYCSEGDRSKIACEIICNELNYKKVFNLEKGINQWKKEGYPIDNTRVSRLKKE